MILTNTGFRAAIAHTTARMEDGARQAVRSALRGGEKVVSCGRYRVGGPLVLRVTVPASWRNLEVYRNTESVSCTVPADREAETLAWLEKRGY